MRLLCGYVHINFASTNLALLVLLLLPALLFNPLIRFRHNVNNSRLSSYAFAQYLGGCKYRVHYGQ